MRLAEKCVIQLEKLSRSIPMMNLGNCEESSELISISNCVLETFRLSPQVDYTDRKCRENFTSSSPDNNELHKFEIGDIIHFPIKILLNHRTIFKHPELFHPDRFKNETENEFIRNFIDSLQCPAIKLSMNFIEIFLKAYLNRCDSSFKYFTHKLS